MRRNKTNKGKLFSIWILVIAIIYGLFSNNIDGTYANNNDKSLIKTDVINEENNLEVYFLDVGQADSILISNKDEYMLIDAGNNEDGQFLVNFFHSLDIKEFKYVVATHPDEDHIGGLDDVINNFMVNNIYMPDVITTSRTFEDLLDAIALNNLSFNVLEVDETFTLGSANFKVIHTGTDDTDLNNASIILRMDYKEVSFLFTGDAGKKVEREILNKDIKADVLKVGHHGSKYSSSSEFLDKVDPKYAVISVGSNNTYNHPNSETLKRLAKRGIVTYRTDELGTVLITTDGSSVTVNNFATDTDG